MRSVVGSSVGVATIGSSGWAVGDAGVRASRVESSETTTPQVTSSHQTWRKPASGSIAVEVVNAMTSETPNVEPTQRVVCMTAEPAPNSSGGRRCTATDESGGRQSDAPNAVQTTDGS